MRSPFRVVAAFVHGPVRRGTGQIVMSVTAGVCVALVTQALIPDHRAPATTEVQRQAAETVTPRDDLRPKAAIAAPVAAIDATETGSVVRAETESALTHVAKLPAVVPRADYRVPSLESGPQPYTPPIAQSDAVTVPPVAQTEGEIQPAPAAGDYASYPTSTETNPLLPPADIGAPGADVPGQPMVLSGAVQRRDFSGDEEFDTAAPAQAEQRVPILALPFAAVERSVFKLGDVLASMGKPEPRY